MSDIQARASTWSQPISEDAPCGVDCRYEDAFEQVDTEIKKLQSLDGQLPDWGQVIDLSTDLLQQHTKDTTVFAALCVGLMQRDGYAGLAAGLLAFEEVARNHWEQMYPGVKRLKGRAGDYTWMVHHLIKIVTQGEPGPEDHLAVKSCAETFDSLDGYLREQFGELHPAVGQLKRPLAAYVEQTAPAPEAAAPQQEEAVAEWAGDKTPTELMPAPDAWSSSPAAPLPAGFLPDAIVSEEHAEQVVDQAARALKLASEYYEKQRAKLEEEKGRIEQRIDHAERVVKMQQNVTELMEDDGGESSSE